MYYLCNAYTCVIFTLMSLTSKLHDYLFGKRGAPLLYLWDFASLLFVLNHDSDRVPIW